MTHPKALFLIAILSFPLTNAHADRKWNEDNDPRNLDGSYIMDFNRLPLSGGIAADSKRGWADSYWPTINGSIANRWQVSLNYDKKGKNPTYNEINNMSDSQLDLLSPAEKFDLARGKLNFPIASEIRKNYKSNGKDWHGICNGWTHSSLNYDEPRAIVYVSPTTKKKIPFGSSDIKGLLAYYHAFMDDSGAKFIGKSCRPGSKVLFNLNGACTDVHAAAFHIMMTNELGIKHQGFAADRDPGVEVWNQPFVKYESRIDDIKTSKFSHKATEGTRKEVYITSTVSYVDELYDTLDADLETADHVKPSYQPVLGTEKQRLIPVEYKYVIELDSRDRIIGGEWISADRPDLIWRQDFRAPGMAADDKGKPDDWSMLTDIVKMATSAIPANEP